MLVAPIDEQKDKKTLRMAVASMDEVTEWGNMTFSQRNNMEHWVSMQCWTQNYQQVCLAHGCEAREEERLSL